MPPRRGRAFWRWWASTPALALLITEGAKKAAACSRLAYLLWHAGIWNGARKGPNGRGVLIDWRRAPRRSPGFGCLLDAALRRNPTSKAARAWAALRLEKAGARSGGHRGPGGTAAARASTITWPAVAAGAAGQGSSRLTLNLFLPAGGVLTGWRQLTVVGRWPARFRRLSKPRWLPWFAPMEQEKPKPCAAAVAPPAGRRQTRGSDHAPPQPWSSTARGGLPWE